MKDPPHLRRMRTEWTTRVVAVSSLKLEDEVNAKFAELNRLQFNVTGVTVESGQVFIFAQRLSPEAASN